MKSPPRDTSVFVESSGNVRVADFSIDKRVRELWSRSPTPSSPAFEDKFPVAIGRGGKKADVYRDVHQIACTFHFVDIKLRVVFQYKEAIS